MSVSKSWVVGHVFPPPSTHAAMLTAAFQLMHSNADYVHVEATIIPGKEESEDEDEDDDDDDDGCTHFVGCINRLLEGADDE
ncbi:hypothetical protein Asppvi_000227 [Aspergillus pseudoviridinutans]|uniref:Uncharacterized protein n=1 Tax=Aspergillus pseudoviridinutans TaxID=1517512 RepID=A0A9P3EPL1_9EURO|nr:uncharacterized protein Asppvi_000227 [Aspergillus pseudoviridinutans]GIJ81727.1 hypothetical protein Asppvi_000227 [Aspergillus pseudoviridinutans]